VLSALSESAARWLAGGKLARMTRTSMPVGTTFRFSLNRAAHVRLDFTQKRNGRKVSRGCVPQTRRNSSKPRCRRTATIGTLSLAAHTGANQVRFQGRISGAKTLKPGRYTLIVSATDSAGHRSLPHKLTFTIVKR